MLIEKRYEIAYRYLVEKNYAAALPYLQEAAEQGHEMAYLWLEQIYKNTAFLISQPT